MHFQTPTLVSLTGAAWRAFRNRTQLFFLLAMLSGILSAFLYLPATQVVAEILVILNSNEPANAVADDLSAAISEGAPTLFVGHLLVTAVTTFLIVPWARAAAPGNLTPSAGGIAAFVRRGLRSFLHMIAANGLTILLALVGLPLAAALTASFGGLGNAVMMTAIVLMIWAAFAFTSLAHLAIAAEARDRKDTILTAWSRGRFFLMPITASLALMFLLAFVADLIIAPILLAVLPESMGDMFSMAFSGMILFAASALHVAALYIVPDFRDLRPS
ncbi:hypothetical protein [Kordiimonas aestuarii]|uniref:hypothetical protein n=1 Tax=Kordiimonas aestuarii TaxID=1005925 RepID=UPI0021D19D46|nr:hypothetical protein [Kordiimonas aestuarii]